MRVDRNLYSTEDSLARATALISGLRGLAIDRYVTGDAARPDRAAQLLITAATAEAARAATPQS